MATKVPKADTPAKPKAAAAPKAAAPKRVEKPAPVVAAPAPEVKVKAAPKPKPVAAKVVAPDPVPEPVAVIIEPVIEAIVPAPAIAEPDVTPELTHEITPAADVPAEPVPRVAAVTEAPTAPTPAKEVNIMKSTIESGMEKSKAVLADMTDRTKVAMEKGGKMVEDMNEFAKGNVEALVESGKIAAKGFETMGQDAAEYSRKSFESATAVMKSMAAVKSPTDLFKLQSDFMRSMFDSAVAETSKGTEAMIKLAGDAAQPISSRVAIAVEKVKIAA